MTYKQAIQEARETAMQSGRGQIIFYRKPHWWNCKNYDYAGFYVFNDLDDVMVAGRVYPDGKLH
jgi:hypothetical protein